MIKKTDFDQTFSHQMAEVNGVKIHFVEGGTGEPVVLLHGNPTWSFFLPPPHRGVAPNTARDCASPYGLRPV